MSLAMPEDTQAQAEQTDTALAPIMTPDSAASDAPKPVSKPAADDAITIEKLVKQYDGADVEALKGIDLRIPKGCIFGLLGPNGAGKSTLINILAGLTRKTAGFAAITGYDVDLSPRAAKMSIGVVPQELNLDSFFSARELLDFQAGLYNVPPSQRQTDHLLEVFDLKLQANASTRALSGGMRRRLMVAKAMVHRPSVLVLDEPTAGVDVELRRHLWHYVRKLNEAGTTILLTTHYLEEAEALCDQIAILDKGNVVACDTKDNLLRRLDRKQVSITVDRDLPEVPGNLKGMGWQQTGPRRLTLTYRPSQSTIGRILLAVQVNGLVITDLSTEESDLEDVFLLLTSQKA